MRTPSILWAEDEDGQFTSCLAALTTFLSERGGVVNVTRAPSGDDVRDLLATSDRDRVPFDVLICDLEMPGWDGINTILEVAKAWPHLPVVILSSKLERPDLRHKVERLAKDGCAMAHFAADPFGEWREHVWSLIRVRPFSMLHMSDIHFGQFHAFPKTSVEDLVAKAIPALRSSANGRIDAIVITGDLASEGHTAEFDRADKFVRSVCGELNVGLDCVVIVPGNHDIHRANEHAFRFDNFMRFVQNIHGGESDDDVGLSRYPGLPGVDAKLVGHPDDGPIDDRLYSQTDFPHANVRILGLNSVIAADDTLLGSGRVSTTQLIGMDKAATSQHTRHGHRLTIAAFHHHLFEPATLAHEDRRNRALENGGLVVRSLLDQGVQILLHGHTHYATAYEFRPLYDNDHEGCASALYVFSAGTVGALEHADGQSCFALNLLRADPSDQFHAVSISPFRFRLPGDSLSWQVDDAGRFELPML